MIHPTDLTRVRRQVDKATKAACRSTYKPSGGRLYEEIYFTEPESADVSYAGMRAARYEREVAEMKRLGIWTPGELEMA